MSLFYTPIYNLIFLRLFLIQQDFDFKTFVISDFKISAHLFSESKFLGYTYPS